MTLNNFRHFIFLSKDIDWEYPNFSENAPQDKANFITLLQTLKQTVGSDYSVSATIGTGAWRTDLSFDIAGIFQTVDFVNVMTYDLHGSWETVTGINAPLYRSSLDNTDSNVDAAVKLIMSQGGLAEKLIMGIPTYGNAFSLSDQNQNGVGAPATGAGSWKFSKICQKINDGSLKYVWDDDQKVPYAFAGSDWVGYDDVKSVTEKAKYINDNNFGGAMIWDLDSDDYSNACGLGNYPLISAIHDNIAGGRVARKDKTDITEEHQSKYSMQLNMEVAVETKGKITPGIDKFQSEVLNYFFKTDKISLKAKKITFPWMN